MVARAFKMASRPPREKVLQDAVAHGRLDVLTKLLAAGADPDKPYDGRFCLSQAARNGELECARALLAAGASVDVCGEDGCTPLLISLMQPDSRVTILLLENGAKVDVTALGQDLMVTAVQLKPPPESIEAVLRSPDALVLFDRKQHRSWVVCILQAYFPDREQEGLRLLRAALEAGHDPNTPDFAGWTPLMYCFAPNRDTRATGPRGCPEAVALLAKHGAKLDSAHSKSGGFTALGVASSFGGSPDFITAYLEAGADVSKALMVCEPGGSKVSSGALSCAAHSANVDVAKICLSHGADVNARARGDGTDHDVDSGRTPIMYAVQVCENDAEPKDASRVRMIALLVRHGADVNAKDDRGCTALILAALNGMNSDVLKALLDAGARVNERDHEGTTALDYARAMQKNTSKATFSKRYLKRLRKVEKLLVNAGGETGGRTEQAGNDPENEGGDGDDDGDDACRLDVCWVCGATEALMKRCSKCRTASCTARVATRNAE